jgi:membrane protease YdiL (CAAX protease family)
MNGTPSQWGLWATIAWGVVIAIFFTIVQSVVTIVGIAAGDPLPDDVSEEQIVEAASSGTIIALATVATAILGTALIAGIVKLKRGAVLGDYLALRPVPIRSLLMWLAILVVYVAIADTLTSFIDRDVVPEFMRDAYASANPMWLLWIALVVGAPLFEETFFRGFLFKGLASSRLGVTGAIVITAAAWALIHLQYEAYEMAVIFVMGLLLGLARARTGSLFVPLAAHGLANLIATVETAIVAP